MVFNDESIKEKLLEIIRLHGKTRSQNKIQSFYLSLLEWNVPILELLSVTTNGAPEVTIETAGLIGLCREDPALPEFFIYHPFIQRQALCTDVIDNL
jgi:hypothetical protein